MLNPQLTKLVAHTWGCGFRLAESLDFVNEHYGENVPAVVISTLQTLWDVDHESYARRNEFMALKTNDPKHRDENFPFVL